MFAGLLPLLPGTAPAAAAAELSPAQKALARAEETGERVELTGERSEYSSVFANPDGETFTLSTSIAPMRVKQADGAWAEPDATLVRAADGAIRPKAAATGLEFSPGGQAPLATISDQGRELSVGWSGELPEPSLEGATATYPDVLPDVDLKVTASVTGFQHVLVVETPEAAAGPALKELQFSLQARGLKVREAAAGGLDAVDGNGKALFKAPAAFMWDSSGNQSSAAPSKAKAMPRSGSVAALDAGPAGPGEHDRSQGPAPGDEIAEVHVQVGDDTLSVAPDADMLTSTPASAFPLYIDPDVSWGEYERTLIRSDGYTDYNWTGDEGVGECHVWGGYYCDEDGYRQRLIFEMSGSKLKGKHVLDATFRLTETWSFSCDPTWVQLWRTGSMSSRTSWPGPDRIDMMGDRHVSAGRGDACTPSQPAKPIEFNDNPGESNENLTTTVKRLASGDLSRLTLMLKSQDETTTKGWKRFKNDAVLDVTYVGIPARPTNVGLVQSGKKTSCETDADNAPVTADPTPAVGGYVQTQSGGQDEAKMRMYFDIDVENSDGTWSDVSPGGSDLDPTSGYVGDGTWTTKTWDNPLEEGPLYRLRAWALSYWDNGNKYLDGPSNATGAGWCYFTVDPTAPAAPALTVGAPYQECQPNDCPAAGAPGTPTMITATPAAGDTITGAEYWTSATDEWSPMTADGSTYTAQVTPDRSGTFRVLVELRDQSGRESERGELDFLVQAGEGPVARWHFDETSGVAVDSATTADSAQQDATLHTGATRDDRGRRGLITTDAQGDPMPEPVTDRGMALDGDTGYAATNGPVLETRSAYTISAWARLNSTDGDSIILSQDGGNYSPFILWYEPDYGTWAFGVKEADEATGTAYYGVVAEQPAAANVWTHVAGTYDSATKKLQLYVNGVLQGTTQSAGSWDAGGAFQIGRYQWAGQRMHYFDGSIDEVAAWQRVLTAAEIADEARLLMPGGHAGAELVAAWDPSTGTGTTVTDTVSGYGRDLTLAGGSALDGEALVLDGNDGHASTPGPLVDGTGSFTTTTYVEPDKDTLAAAPVGSTVQVLQQPAADGAAWGIWFEVTGKQKVLNDDFEEETLAVGRWHFGRPGAAVVTDADITIDGTGYRLSGVHDAQDGTATLYVSDVQHDVPTAYTAKVGQGAFTVGRSVSGDFMPGRVWDVRVWAGAAADHEQLINMVGE
ncbi:LamG domain-containing protein [Streptomyces sp. RKND-216]|uniref:LamG domain-containing protein n=1 Tax=Streptomyces sp. RKND-216 TaxID=2562581 RepID=UPI001FFAE457|nr:LamG domain-containing protein [Streptomyces sp. RKND-216]